MLTWFGEPDTVYRKHQDKLRIHELGDTNSTNTKEHSSDGEYDKEAGNNDYFYNWYGLGMDVLLDGSSHLAKKVILHSNFPGHYDFDR